MMLTKTNIFLVENYLGGNTDRQQFENDKQNVDVAPPGKISADAHEWSCFLAFVFSFTLQPGGTWGKCKKRS